MKSHAIQSRQVIAFAGSLIVAFCFCASVRASLVVGSHDFGGDVGLLSASAKFEFDSGTKKLTITLTNTSTLDVVRTSQALGGLFFDVAGANLSLSGSDSAILPAGSTVLYANAADNPDNVTVNGTLNGTGDVSPEWAFANTGPDGQANGVSSSGYNLFGPGDRFNTQYDLDSPRSPDGSNYLITSAGDDASTGNSGLINDPIIRNSVVFTLTSDADFDPQTDISNVRFQYGTSIDEPSFRGMPEPGSVFVWSLLAIGVGFSSSRRTRA